MTQCFPLSLTTDQFGNQQVADYNPQIQVAWQNPSTGKSVNVNAEFDSGAFISLAPLSLATILGVSPASGPIINLQGVGGSNVTAYVHQLTLQLGSDVYQGVYVAIGTDEALPFLIGRVNFWDLASANIDNTTRQICITQLSPGTPGAGATTPPSTVDLLTPLAFLGLAGGILYFGGFLR